MHDIIMKRIKFFSILLFDFLFFTVIFYFIRELPLQLIIPGTVAGYFSGQILPDIVNSVCWLLYLIAAPRVCKAVLELLKLVSSFLMVFVMSGDFIRLMPLRLLFIQALLAGIIFLYIIIYIFKMDKRIRSIIRLNFYYEDEELISLKANIKPVFVMVAVLLVSQVSGFLVFRNNGNVSAVKVYRAIGVASMNASVPDDASLIGDLDVEGLNGAVIAELSRNNSGKVYFYLKSDITDSGDFEIDIKGNDNQIKSLYKAVNLKPFPQVSVKGLVLDPGKYDILVTAAESRGRIELYAGKN